MCEQAGVDVVWAPSAADVYPDGTAQVRVDPGPLGAELEGAVRPEHFGGVLTVVAKLLNLTRPAVAFFGEKDYQQLTLIRRMAADLELGVGIAGVPTVREADGLALSSRNVFLSRRTGRLHWCCRGRCWPGSRPRRAGLSPCWTRAPRYWPPSRASIDYLALRGRTSARRRSTARPGCWWRAGSAAPG